VKKLLKRKKKVEKGNSLPSKRREKGEE